jgi:hypothetical protein
VALFASGTEFESILGGFFEEVAANPLVAQKLLASNLVIRFRYTDPDAVLLVDCSGDTITVRAGDISTKAEVDMSMTADIAHKFWFGKVNLMQALTRKQMIARGPVPRILKLLPAIKPTYAMYPQYLQAHGYGHYVVY